MAFLYQHGALQVGDETRVVEVEPLVRPLDRPAYVYDLDEIDRRFRVMNEALSGAKHTIHYAMKANSNSEILRRLSELGAGVDTVSGGEIQRALEAGVPAQRIIFSGVGKTRREIEVALGERIKQINVESPQELERIGEIADRLGATADVAFRLNPDVNPKTHPYITTGFRDNKFGMDESFMPELRGILARWPKRLRLRGFTMHIGSLLFDLGVIREAIEKTIAVHDSFKKEGHPLDRLDIGGGLGIDYGTEDEAKELDMIKQYGRMAIEATRGMKVELLTEPGRVLVARAGLLVGQVQYIKATASKTFAIVDTGMHHLIRPALYGSKHRVLPLRQGTGKPVVYDIVGPICESSDFLAKDVSLPELKPGDRIGIADAGAYGFTMASQYNSHELPGEIVVSAKANLAPGVTGRMIPR
ncbi:MAG: diaminopimelate decarboxylase [Planctomycetes bacterium]|nr:diaminopimelate decarboxylase [Planctomycetota bacterium]